MDWRYFSNNNTGRRSFPFPVHHRHHTISHKPDNIQLQYQAGVTARLEAQRNKERALLQTYRSVLSPEPSNLFFEKKLQPRRPVTHPLPHDICQGLETLSRHSLLSALSALRRLDPDESGTLPSFEIENVMRLYNIKFNHEKLESLFFYFKSSNNETNYNALWEFLMDSFAKRGNLNIHMSPTSVPSHLNAGTHDIPKGVEAKLQYELRQYARSNRKTVDLSSLKRRFVEYDPYYTGKILRKHVHQICYEELDGIDRSLLHDVIVDFDTERNGLISYNNLLAFFNSCQGTYLPPLKTIPPINTNSFNNNIKADSGSNIKKLQDVGELDMHLSDFETNVVSKPVKYKDSDRRSVSFHRSSSTETYTVESPVLSSLTDNNQPTKRRQWNSIEEGKKIFKTLGKSFQETDKWWKNNITPDEQLRKSWKESGRIKTVKSRKRRQKSSLRKIEKQGKDNDYSGSDAYTTTDIEVGETVGYEKYTTEDDDASDNNTKSIIQSSTHDSISAQYKYVEDASGSVNDTMTKSSIVSSKHVTDDKKNNDIDIKMEDDIKEEQSCMNEVDETATLNEVDETGNLMELEWIYGHDGIVEALSSHELMYSVGDVFIVFNTKENTQRFFKEHTSTILKYCICSESKLIASVQKEKQNLLKMLAWDSSSLSLKSTSTIMFDQQEELLSMTWMGQDIVLLMKKNVKDRIMYLYSIDDSCILRQCQVHYVTDLCASKDLIFLLGKNGTVKFVSYEDFHIEDRDYGDMTRGRHFTAAVFDSQKDCLISGDSSGTLLIWKGNEIQHAITNAFHASVVALAMGSSNYLFACARDGSVLVWNKARSLCFSKLNLPEKYGIVEGMKCHDNSLFIITNSCILNVPLKEDADDPLKNALSHLSVLSEFLTDVAVSTQHHLNYSNFVVCLASDGEVTMLNTETKSTVWSFYVRGNGSCLAPSKSSNYIVVGCQDGSLHIIDAMNGSHVDKYKHRNIQPVCIRFSQDDNYVAVGYADEYIVIFKWENCALELLYEFKFDHDKITSLTWMDGCEKLIISTSIDNKYSYNMNDSHLSATKIEAKTIHSKKHLEEKFHIHGVVSVKQLERRGKFVIATEDLIYLAAWPNIVPKPMRHSHGKGINMSISPDNKTLISSSEISSAICQWKISSIEEKLKESL